ncbi:uncharacterized protein DUF2135 [Tahibacter aquaticus]|uniref:Uncharacterized protein DUF2135 n=1 Tax=Tahibacter aquaticus TaxID=520092 RepID=A0A4R6YN59_9GAMM|nr:VIT domain-containing protein [Tahibacter aquaticus]TDR38994.1 uncharacterized protein DUF2135 [Tahibacter aquaticus]
MNTLWQGLFVVLLACSASAQASQPIQIAPPPPPPPSPPQVWLDPALGLQPIVLQNVSIDIRLQGFVASTRVDLTFFNPNARVLEGELVFPLAEGQSITGYALEVDGKLRQGVVVEKETARVAFEQTTRRRIDPGLAELTQGNVFRTRLYPIPARGSKQVQLSFDQPLIDTGKAYRYVLPLQFAQAIAQFKVHAEAIQTQTAPSAQIAGARLGFQRWRDSFVADLEQRDFRPDGPLAFELPKPAAAVAVFAVPGASEPATQFFAAQIQSAAPARQAAPAPKRIAIYYDASGSAAARNRGLELDFLQAWLAQWREAQIELIVFRNEADAAQSFGLRAGKADGLRQAIEALPLDGASAYGSLQGKAVVKADLAIVIGDGLNNFGVGEPQLGGAEGASRVVFVHAAQTADAARLTRWARRFEGDVINLLNLDQAAALRQLAAPHWSLRATRVQRGRCDDLAPSAPQPAGSTFTLYGRCSADAEIQLEFGDGYGTTLLRRVALGSAQQLDAQHGEFVPRLWAVARIADLELAPVRDKESIVELAKKYSVVTQETSMLVLDRIEDYVHYRVEPREPELLAAYRNLLQKQPAQTSEDEKLRLNVWQLRSHWETFRQYHEQPHPWLEARLLPAAQRELALWQTQSGLAGEPQRAKEAAAIAAAAAKLQQAWPAAAPDAAARQRWEGEATALMLQVDGLRRARLQRLPDSDAVILPPTQQIAVASTDTDAVSGGRSGGESRVARSMLRPAAKSAARPAPAAAPAAETLAAPAPAARAASPAIRPAEPDGGGSAQKPTEIATADKNAAAATPDTAAIELREWDPNTPYLAALRAAADPYAAYLQQRASNAATPAFFLDCSTFFRDEAKDARLALRVLSNLAEIDFDSAPLLRVFAYRLQQWQRFDLAVPLFEQVLVLRGEEPQSRRDLALALSRQPQPDSARAVTLLWEVASRSWDARFPELDVIAVHELNDVIVRAPAAEQAALAALAQQLNIDKELLQPLPLELRVVLSWDSDNTDIDLWVIDPSGEKVFYSHPRSLSGGHLSRDFTGGYGPEVFTIRRALPGTYIVKTNYFSNRQQKLTGAVTVQLEFLTAFDSGQGRRDAVTRRLENVNGEIEIGRFTVGTP